MFRILWVLIISIYPLFAYHPVILEGDLCHDWNGRRIFVDNNELIILSAKHISPTENRSHCAVNFHSCSFCHFQLRLTHFNLSSCGYRSRARCSCSNLTIHEPPHEYSYFNLCDSYTRDKKMYTHTNELQVALQALQQQEHAFSLRIRVKRNSFLFANNITCRRGLQEKDHVTSPFFPNYYPSNYRVDYIFYNAGGTIRIVFQDFKIGAWSYFEVLERSRERRKVYSGYSFRPPIIESQESEMKIRFIANGVSAMGYRFTYHFLNCSGSQINYTEVPITDCGGTVTNLGGSIVMSHMSHREVKRYDCIWVIKPLISNRYSSDISVRVARFQYMGSNSTLTIHEGATSLSRQVLRLTGDVKLPALKNETAIKRHQSREFIVPTTTGFYIRLIADLGPHSSLAIVYSLFTYDECFSIVDVSCNNSRCIVGDLRCDGFDHCGDGSDEPPGCFDKHHLVQWHSSNYYFPKQVHPDMYQSHVVILGCICLVVLSPVLCGLLFWRITVKGREEFQRQRALELIRELEREEMSSTPVGDIDEPPEYDAPPNYDEALKLGPTPGRRKPTQEGGLLDHLRLFRVAPHRHSTYGETRESPPPYEPTPTHQTTIATRRPRGRQLMRRRVSRSSTCPPILSSTSNTLSLSIPRVSQESPDSEPYASNGLTLNLSGNDQNDTITVSSASNSENVDILSMVTGRSIISFGEEEASVEPIPNQTEQSETNNQEVESIVQRTKKLLFSKQVSLPKQQQRRVSLEGCKCEGACGCNTVIPVKVRKLVFEPKAETLPATYNFQELFKTFWQDSTKTEAKVEGSSANGSKEFTGAGQSSHSTSLVQQAKERLFTSKKDPHTKVPPSRPRLKMRRQKSEPPIFYIDINSSEESPTSTEPRENRESSALQSTQNRNSFPMYGKKPSTDNRGSWEIFQEVMLSAKNFIKPKVAFDKDINQKDSLRKVSSVPTIAEQSTLMHYQSQQTLCSSLESFNFTTSPLLTTRKPLNSSTSRLNNNFDSTCYMLTKTPSLEDIPKIFPMQQAAKKFPKEYIPKTLSLEHISSVEHFSETSSWEHIQKPSSLENMARTSTSQFSPTNYSLTQVSKTTLSEQSQTTSSLEHAENDSSSKNISKTLSLEETLNSSSLEQILKMYSTEHNTSSLENIPKPFSLKQIPKISSLEDTSKISSTEDITKTVSLEDMLKISFLQNISKMSSSEGIPTSSTTETGLMPTALEINPKAFSLETIPKPASEENVLKTNSLKDIPNTSSSEGISITSAEEDILKGTTLKDIPNTSSVEDLPNTSSEEDILKTPSLKDISNTFSAENISKTASEEYIPKTYVSEDIPKISSFEHISKTLSKEIPKSSSLEDPSKTDLAEEDSKNISFTHISKDSPSEDDPKPSSLEDIARTSLSTNISETCSITEIPITSSSEDISICLH